MLYGMHDGKPNHTIREQEAARYLGLSVAWLRQGRMRGRGPSFLRIGRAIRYRVDDLDEYLSSHRVESRELRYTDAPLELTKR